MARSADHKRASSPRREPKQERSKALVDAILTATAHLLCAAGPSATTTNKIAKRAGVSVGSLYQYFPNKTALYTALAQRHVAKTEAELVPLVERLGHEPPEAIVGLVVETLLATASVDARLHAELERLSLWGQTCEVMVEFRRGLEVRLGELLAHRSADLPRSFEDPHRAAQVICRAVGGVLDVYSREEPEALGDPALVSSMTQLVAGYLGYG